MAMVAAAQMRRMTEMVVLLTSRGAQGAGKAAMMVTTLDGGAN